MGTPVAYLEPLPDNVIVTTMEELLSRPGEHELAWACIQLFINKYSQDEGGRRKLQEIWRKRGWSMFQWQYYRAARHYLGTPAALSAHLVLRGL